MGYLGWSQGWAEVLILRERLGGGTLQCKGIMGTDDAVCQKEKLATWLPQGIAEDRC